MDEFDVQETNIKFDDVLEQLLLDIDWQGEADEYDDAERVFRELAERRFLESYFVGVRFEGSHHV